MSTAAIKTFHSQFNPASALKAGELVYLWINRWSFGSNDFIKGKVTRVAYGKVTAEFEDGKTRSFNKDGAELDYSNTWISHKIISYMDNFEVVMAIRDEAKRIQEIVEARDHVMRSLENMGNHDPKWVKIKELLDL